MGRASSFATILVTDGQGLAQPPGAAGHIAVKGETVFAGYSNVESSSKFIPYITQGEKQIPGPWYKTGDFGFLDESGELHLCGRQDDQVKVNGQVC